MWTAGPARFIETGFAFFPSSVRAGPPDHRGLLHRLQLQIGLDVGHGLLQLDAVERGPEKLAIAIHPDLALGDAERRSRSGCQTVTWQVRPFRGVRHSGIGWRE